MIPQIVDNDSLIYQDIVGNIGKTAKPQEMKNKYHSNYLAT